MKYDNISINKLNYINKHANNVIRIYLNRTNLIT